MEAHQAPPRIVTALTFDELLELFVDAWATGSDDTALDRARDAASALHPSQRWSPPLETPWPSIEEYVLAHDCPRCDAPAGVECTVRNGRCRFHAPRSDRGLRRYRRDVRRAPWREDRVPGRRYDTLQGSAA